ncbi:MAG: transposase [Spirochaetaceae bacterium]|jgi:hypothetical protein|nr:transposase [Spirochaetaceae bacterium]
MPTRKKKRRYFFEAQKVCSQTKTAAIGIKYIKQLYDIEGELRAAFEGNKLSAREFSERRRERAQVVLEQFKGYLDSDELTPDNNLTENAIRPFREDLAR